MPTTYKRAEEHLLGDLIRSNLGETIRAHDRFKPIADFDLKIDLLLAWNDKGPAVKHHGAPALATIKVVSGENRELGQGDVQIKIDAAEYVDLTPRQRRALLAHELYRVQIKTHTEIVRDDDGTERFVFRPDLDDYERPVVKLIPDDWTVTGFRQVAEWYGEDSAEVRTHRRIGELLAQALLPGFAAPVADVAAARPFDDEKTTPEALLRAVDNSLRHGDVSESEWLATPLDALDMIGDTIRGKLALVDVVTINAVIRYTVELGRRLSQAGLSEIQAAIVAEAIAASRAIWFESRLEASADEELAAGVAEAEADMAQRNESAPSADAIEPDLETVLAAESDADQADDDEPFNPPVPQLFVVWSGRNPVYAVRALNRDSVVAYVEHQHPSDARLTVKLDDGTVDARQVPVRKDLTVDNGCRTIAADFPGTGSGPAPKLAETGEGTPVPKPKRARKPRASVAESGVI